MLTETKGPELHFLHLPAFAAWLLQHIDEYTTELVRLFYAADLPLLRAIQHLTEEEKYAFSKRLNIEFLTNISQNNAAGHLEAVTNRWLADQFEHVGKLVVEAKDITLINHIRSKAQKSFINRYTTDPTVAHQLHAEIDDLSFAYSTRSINDYLQVLREKIQAEEHFSSQIIQASPGITFIYDLVEQREVYITGRVEEVTGFTPQEVLAKKDLIAELTHPDDLPVVSAFLQRVIEDKQGISHFADYRFRNKRSGYQWLRCYAIVYKRNTSGEPLQLLGTAYDVTNEKETQESLRQKSLDLERSNEQLQQYASIASHDLKEPLRKIGMFSDIIISTEWDSLSERTRINLQKITYEATRMQKLIEGVLSYSSINLQLQKERVVLEELLQEAISNLDYSIKETGAVITSDGLPDADVIPLQMQQLFQNLLSNALKFSKKLATPEITITHQIIPADLLKEKDLLPVNQYLQISVKDNGIGFSPEVGEKIFGMFQRLHNRSDYEGSGIGLAICKRIVENHGGAISASSEVGAGATFIITLPDFDH